MPQSPNCVSGRGDLVELLERSEVHKFSVIRVTGSSVLTQKFTDSILTQS